MKQKTFALLTAVGLIAVMSVVSIAGTTANKSSKPAVKSAKASTKAAASKPKTTPKALPRLLELGSTKCTPCKMMKPVLDQLEKQYKGKLKVEFIDVWENKGVAEKYKIQSIPTQIFFDAKGKEVARHAGYFPKDDILATFKKHGINLSK